MTEIIMKKREAHAGEVGLFPVDDESNHVIGRIKMGKDVGCDVIQRRNPKHLRLFFAILHFLQIHSWMWEGAPIEQIKTAVKVATGLGETFIDTGSGETVFVPRSISIAAMDQTAFDAFFDDAVNVIANRWMPPGTSAQSVRAELMSMIEDPRLPWRRG